MNLSACSLTSYFTCNLCSIFDFITVAAPYFFLKVFGMFFRLKTDKNLYSCTFRDIIIFLRRLNEELLFNVRKQFSYPSFSFIKQFILSSSKYSWKYTGHIYAILPSNRHRLPAPSRNP